VVGTRVRVYSLQGRHIQINLKAVDLPPKGVPGDGDVHQTQQGLLAAQ